MVNCCIGHHINNDDALWCTACGSLVERAMIGDYRLISYVGNGSSADVYLAEQPLLNNRKVVIKILHSSWSEARVSSFQREAAALATFSHPYILPVFAYGVLYKESGQKKQPGRAEPVPYLVLPFAEQGSLEDIFTRQGKRPWPLARVDTMVKEIAEALDFAHAQGILHRDVKPANILQMGSHAVLSDFSVAALIDANVSHLNTPWAGSPGYMAPEVWRLHPGRYSDQYALAVSAYYLLTAQLPWQRSSGMHTFSWLELHCFVAPRSILELCPDMPSAIDVVLQHALSKDPHDRYATAQAFAADLYAASQDITREINPLPAIHRSHAILVQSALIKTEDRPTRQVVDIAPELPYKADVESPVDQATPLAISDMCTDSLNAFQHEDKWVWFALTLNLLTCLAVAAEYAWQQGGIMLAANVLLAVWPALLSGPLLANLFRRVNYTTLSWGLFWGTFFGLTDALLSALLCLAWTVLALLLAGYHCSSGCQSANGFGAAIQVAANLAPQAVVPIVLSLWIATIGGAMIGVAHVRST